MACLIAGASTDMAFIEASASASGCKANGLLTGPCGQRSVSLGRGTRANMCLARDSIGFGRGTMPTMCFGRDRAYESPETRTSTMDASKPAHTSVWNRDPPAWPRFRPDGTMLYRNPLPALEYERPSRPFRLRRRDATTPKCKRWHPIVWSSPVRSREPKDCRQLRAL
jgi:hypothetical protein